MSVLKSKSQESIAAAEILLKQNHANSSIHCSYYSCVQLMLHLLRKHFGKTELAIKSEGIKGAKNDNGYHNWLLNSIFKEFVRLDGTDAAKFNGIIQILKKQRAAADYENRNIEFHNAEKAYSQSLIVHQLIKKNFQI